MLSYWAGNEVTLLPGHSMLSCPALPSTPTATRMVTAVSPQRAECPLQYPSSPPLPHLQQHSVCPHPDQFAQGMLPI